MNQKSSFYLKFISVFYTILVMIIFFATSIFAQDSLENTIIEKQPKKSSVLLKRSILPTALILTGTVLNGSHFEKNIKTKIRNQVGNTYEFKIDNYIQYVPVVELYLADILGAKSKNHWFDQTKYLFFSQLFSSTITYSLKEITQKTRPNGHELSFPSGHTTLAFTNATVLKNEFKDSSPLLAYSGYSFAIATGTF